LIDAVAIAIGSRCGTILVSSMLNLHKKKAIRKGSKRRKEKETNNSNKLTSSPTLLKANSRIVRGLIGYH
jgi:hypothetical protein